MKVFFMLSAVLLLTYSIGYWLKNKDSKNFKQSINYSSCDPSKKICKINNDDIVYTINFNRQPLALTPFEVSVDVDDKQPESVLIEFEMGSMDMGFNEYLLIKKANNWRANVILPICSLGENEWLLRVKFKYESEENVTYFNFMQTHVK